MPRQVPTTLRPRVRAQARGGSLLHRVPNRPPRFPTSTPPPGPSAHPSGFSIRSQQGSIGFNPTAFKAPVRTSVATEFNSGERRYYTTNPGAVTLRALGAGRLLASDSLPCLRKARCKTPVRHRFRGHEALRALGAGRLLASDSLQVRLEYERLYDPTLLDPT